MHLPFYQYGSFRSGIVQYHLEDGEYFTDFWTILIFMLVVTLAFFIGRWYLTITQRRKVEKEKQT
jgi:hypothetical protein